MYGLTGRSQKPLALRFTLATGNLSVPASLVKQKVEDFPLETKGIQALGLDPAQHRRLASTVMRRQARLSITIASIFLLMLFGLPLVNRFMPELASRPVFGFTASWFFLGVLFYPITWLLSWIFIRQSDKIESEIAESIRREGSAVTASEVIR
jgi:uncharacterized membrane protein (DUF485 family)